jgi:hypothetical protein
VVALLPDKTFFHQLKASRYGRSEEDISNMLSEASFVQYLAPVVPEVAMLPQVREYYC